MTTIAGTVSPATMNSLMSAHTGEMLKIKLTDGRTLTGRSTGRLLQVEKHRDVDGNQQFEIVRVSAYDVVGIETV